MPILKPSPAALYGSGLFRAGGARSLMRVASLVVLTVAALVVSIVGIRPAFAQTDSLTGNGAAALRACIGGDNVSFTQKIDGRLIYAREIFGSGSGTQALQADGGPIKYTLGYYPRNDEHYIAQGEVANITLSVGGGARFHDPITAGDVRTYMEDGTEISDATNVRKLTGGNVGDDRVTFEFAFNGKDLVEKIKARSTIVFSIPPLAVTDFDPSRSVTITSAIRSVATSGENYFPAGPAGRCLSDAANDGSCVYARTVPYVQHLVLGPRSAVSRYPLPMPPSSSDRSHYLIGAQQNTRVAIRIGGAGFADGEKDKVNSESKLATVQSLYIPSGVAGLSENTTKDAMLLGQVRIFAGSTESLRSQTACDQLKYGTDDLVRPLKADGTPFQPSADDVIELAVTPDIDQNTGHYIYRQIRIGNRAIQGAFRDMSEDGTVRIRMTDLAPLGLNSQYGNEEWELFFVPGSATLEHGDNYTFRARALFDGAPHATVNSQPSSRSVALGLEGLMPNAVAYAIPPPSSPDEAFVRIRCENRDAACDVFLDCSNQVGDSWFARMEGTVPSGGTTVLTRAGIAAVLSSQGFDADTHWGGAANGRLACEILSTDEGMLSSQVLVRSGSSGPLTNNTHVNSSSPQRP
ncbi:hypothetical protein [Thioalkalivibrio sp. HK1]|uniref:hypothetical protein n=1 Tax=Thioalkalivibrio sp. HK1 TaxID=1469245 RepID=UPI0004724A96|nr:hypothetical protein [Thioalkalivibrio sp. HK1]